MSDNYRVICEFMHELNFVDRSFDQDATGIYSISLQVNQNGLAYCISDDPAHNYVVFRKHRFNHVFLISDLLQKIKEVFETDHTLNLIFTKVRFLGYTRQSTLVPDAFFDSHKMVDYLNFNHPDEIDHEVFSNMIIGAGIHNVFALPGELVTIVTQHFKKVEFTSQATPFLRHLFSLENALDKPGVYLGLNADFFDIACTGNSKLRIYNTFQYTNENDLLYYVIFVCNQMGFDPRTIPLYLSGEFSSKLNYYELLKHYIPETRYDVVTGVPALAPGLVQLGPARFLNLLNLQMCASSEEHTEEEE
jgi:hypothetical protein